MKKKIASIIVKTFPSRVEAELAQKMLQAHHIDATVSADDAGGAYPFLLSLGAHVLVGEKDRKKAEELLQ